MRKVRIVIECWTNATNGELVNELLVPAQIQVEDPGDDATCVTADVYAWFEIVAPK